MTVSRSEAAKRNFKPFDIKALGAVPNATLQSARDGSYPANLPEDPHIAILLCTHNGSRFLAEQLDSIRAQGFANLTIRVSDDGSEDETHQILEQYQHLWAKDRFSIQPGPQNGFAVNFLSMICGSDIGADYIAYADQDDIWEADKLNRAISKLEQIPDNVPALYCSRTRLIDTKGCETGYSPLFGKSTGFANALVQNIGGGNTMVMNKAARNILYKAGGRAVISHDWWTYMLISAVGGTIIYDSHPTVRYRQHDESLIGSNIGWRARLLRIRLLFKGRFRNWNTINIQALQEVRSLLTPKNQRILDQFCTARNRWLLPRIWGIWCSGVYRQTFLGNLGLIVATVLKKL